jgi:uncharacterized membrane protein YbhN (UPF0104 family)
MRTLRGNALAVSAGAVLASIVAVIVIAAITGVSLHRIFDHVSGGWFIVVAAAGLASVLPYLVAYRQLTVASGEQPPKLSVVLAVVVAGFGPFVAGGGFNLDRKVLTEVYGDRDTARVQVIGLIALEWAVLAPLVWLAAVILLIGGDHIQASLPWYWAIGVPLGFGVVLWATRPEHRLRWLRRFTYLAGLIDGIRMIHTFLRSPLRTSPAWLSMLLYWLIEVAALYAALRMFGVHLGVVRTALAYGTGYVVTRRSLPLAGAAITEVLLTFALHWCGAALGPALAAVVVYRLFNLVVAAGPALIASRGLLRALDTGSL